MNYTDYISVDLLKELLECKFPAYENYTTEIVIKIIEDE